MVSRPSEALQAHLEDKFKGASICRASIPDGLRKKIQRRLLKELRPGSEGAAAAVAAGVAFADGLRRLQASESVPGSSSQAFVTSQHSGPMRGGGRGGNLRGMPPPPPVWRSGQLPEVHEGRGMVQHFGSSPVQLTVEDILSEPAQLEVDTPAEVPPQMSDAVYARGFRHGFAAAALGDLAQPVQETLVDPYLRPRSEDAPNARAAYDWGTFLGRMWLADKGAQVVLKGCGASGSTGVWGYVLGEILYKEAKRLMFGKEGGEAGAPSVESPVAQLASIIYDEKCSVCLEELEPGCIVVLVHGGSGHACVCKDCFPKPDVRVALHTCPLCRQEVTGHVGV